MAPCVDTSVGHGGGGWERLAAASLTSSWSTTGRLTSECEFENRLLLPTLQEEGDSFEH